MDGAGRDDVGMPALYIEALDPVRGGAAPDLHLFRAAEVAVQAPAAALHHHRAFDPTRPHPSLGLVGVGIEYDDRLAGDDAPVDAAQAPVPDPALVEAQVRPVADN